ncbi:IclR family transcriptional regulator [Cupriavidus plantarum]|uniref:IclR family transcriptional regulator n=2 Tax=Cupriavidus plantarum TaxID=942865 RepID=A0A316F0P6_9BURK|nr:IclR family transcriptional regulator [Cupriavidus plantarum]NYH98139.1 DNA-binding IclR family transcriptional regulator [Cupriavidus plantarum]PWK38231.1 IclR family transcriptional regulator [Cupriavidus plantarum]REE91882.1 IclR family transcriptional regulator [Cupriavidus plantarum]CAG2127575.1 HTH-type transcriptional regulator TsaQ1/TsaQ2 [Cupriavidus plantarum]SMR67247.1 transcriptional regulator, IclR family [Cupriavidus plantarum]
MPNVPTTAAIDAALDPALDSSRQPAREAASGKPAGERESDPNFVTALARGLELLRCFRTGEAMLGNQDFVRRTGFPKATVSRLAGTLVQLGYLRYDASLGKYALDAGVLALGFSYLSASNVVALARPHMLAFAQTHGVSVSLGKRERLEVIYLESIRNDAGAMLGLGVGSRLSLVSSSMGRAYLAALPSARRERVLAEFAQAYPEQWRQQEAPMRAALEAAERLGYSPSFRDWHPAIHACAVAFRPIGERDIHMLSCSASYGAVSEQDFHDRLAPALRALAERLSDTTG